eukprot:5745611-Pyramimonas_sp.AAC.1
MQTLCSLVFFAPFPGSTFWSSSSAPWSSAFLRGSSPRRWLRDRSPGLDRAPLEAPPPDVRGDPAGHASWASAARPHSLSARAPSPWTSRAGVAAGRWGSAQGVLGQITMEVASELD